MLRHRRRRGTRRQSCSQALAGARRQPPPCASGLAATRRPATTTRPRRTRSGRGATRVRLGRPRPSDWTARTPPIVSAAIARYWPRPSSRLARARLRVATCRCHRDEDPESGVHGDACTSGEGQHDEGDPHHEHVDAQVIGKTAGNAGDQLAVVRASELWGGVGGTPRSSHVAGHPARAPVQSQGQVRVVPDGRHTGRAPRSML